jgi:hypothetical protein
MLYYTILYYTILYSNTSKSDTGETFQTKASTVNTETDQLDSEKVTKNGDRSKHMKSTTGYPSIDTKIAKTITPMR